jgi:hypothetical protein
VVQLLGHCPNLGGVIVPGIPYGPESERAYLLHVSLLSLDHNCQASPRQPAGSDGRDTSSGTFLDGIFSCKQIKEDGSRSEEFLINAEFVAMLYFYIAASQSEKTGCLRRLRRQPFYVDRVNLYKGFDGIRAKCQDWRPQLLIVLRGWQVNFPTVARKKNVSLSLLSGVDSQGAKGSRLMEGD